MPKISFTDVKEIEPVPAATYLATIVDAKEGLSESQNPKIDVQWKLDGGPLDGRRVFDTLSFHENALARTKAKLQALGWGKDFSGDIQAADLIGKTAYIVVVIEVSTKQDEDGNPYPDRNKVKKVKPMRAGEASAQAQPARRGFLGRQQS